MRAGLGGVRALFSLLDLALWPHCSAPGSTLFVNLRLQVCGATPILKVARSGACLERSCEMFALVVLTYVEPFHPPLSTGVHAGDLWPPGTSHLRCVCV